MFSVRCCSRKSRSSSISNRVYSRLVMLAAPVPAGIMQQAHQWNEEKYLLRMLKRGSLTEYLHRQHPKVALQNKKGKTLLRSCPLVFTGDLFMGITENPAQRYRSYLNRNRVFSPYLSGNSYIIFDDPFEKFHKIIRYFSSPSCSATLAAVISVLPDALYYDTLNNDPALPLPEASAPPEGMNSGIFWFII